MAIVKKQENASLCMILLQSNPKSFGKQLNKKLIQIQSSIITKIPDMNQVLGLTDSIPNLLTIINKTKVTKAIKIINPEI